MSETTHDFGDGRGPVPAHRHTNPDGTEGGWVADTAAVDATAWVYSEARVYGNARVSGNAQISGEAQVGGNAWVFGNARIYGDARVYGDVQIFGRAQIVGNARIYGDAQVGGDVTVYGKARVYGNTRIDGNARVCGDARIEDTRHWLQVGPVGSEDRHVTIHRVKDGTARIVAGCWAGTPDELEARIDNAWADADKTDRARWQAEYRLVIAAAKARQAEWTAA